jgi:hypothetical protein
MQKPEISSKLSTTKCCVVLKLLIRVIYEYFKAKIIVLFHFSRF